jgi:hypothetical protein
MTDMAETVTVEPIVWKRGPAAEAPRAGGLILEDYAHLLDDLIGGAGCYVIEDESSDKERGVGADQLDAFLAYVGVLDAERFVARLAEAGSGAAFGIEASMPDYAARRDGAVAFVRAVQAAAPGWAGWVDDGTGSLMLRIEA